MLLISLIHFSQSNVSMIFFFIIKYLKHMKTSRSGLQMWRWLEQLGKEVKASNSTKNLSSSSKLLGKKTTAVVKYYYTLLR